MEFFQDKIAVSARTLWENGILSKPNYDYKVRMGKINVLRRGGRSNPALIEFNSLAAAIQMEYINKLGDPRKVVKNKTFTDLIEYDIEAYEFFKAYRKPDGKPLPTKKQNTLRVNSEIYSAISKYIDNLKSYRRARGGSAKGVWELVADAVNNLDTTRFPHSLPGNPKTIERNLRKYRDHGYIALVHKNVGNQNSVKIEGEVADFLLAKYCLPNKPQVTYLISMYETARIHRNWPPLTESAVSQWLNKPEIKRQWVLARHGREEWMRLFGHHVKRDRSQWFPNAWWAIDGTKLDWVHYYDNQLGMAAKLKIDVIIDVYSEKIIGYSYSESETHVDHFKALKMAVSTSAVKPYLFTYDNQSGHKSARMQQLYTQLVATGGTHYPHKARSKSNPIEQVFNRIQQQVISRFWFSDKQSVKARNIDNAPNNEFLLENKHRLLTREQLEKAWQLAVKQWNEAKHPKQDISRNEVYASPAPMEHPVNELDLIQTFWIENSKGSTYRKGGITLKVAGQEYEFEVLTEDNKIDLEFRRKYVGAKFIIKYDPETLDQFVGLYEETDDGLLFINYAKPKRSHEVIPILMQEGDKQRWLEDYEVTQMELERDQKAVNDLRRRTGITEEALIEEQDLLIKLGGDLPKDMRNEVESESFLNQI